MGMEDQKGVAKTAFQQSAAQEEKKFELIPDDKRTYNLNGQDVTVYRIRALRDIETNTMPVKKGELGGYVSSEDNLSQKGNCWIYKQGIAERGARVSENAEVNGNVKDNAQVKGNAMILPGGSAVDNAIVSGNARVHGHIMDNAQAGGNATILNKAIVSNDAVVTGGVIRENITQTPVNPVPQQSLNR